VNLFLKRDVGVNLHGIFSFSLGLHLYRSIIFPMARIFIVTVLVIFINSCAEDTGIDITKTYLNPCDYIIEDFSEINISN
jgi:hypothetical protein